MELALDRSRQLDKFLSGLNCQREWLDQGMLDRNTLCADPQPYFHGWSRMVALRTGNFGARKTGLRFQETNERFTQKALSIPMPPGSSARSLPSVNSQLMFDWSQTTAVLAATVRSRVPMTPGRHGYAPISAARSPRFVSTGIADFVGEGNLLRLTEANDRFRVSEPDS